VVILPGTPSDLNTDDNLAKWATKVVLYKPLQVESLANALSAAADICQKKKPFEGLTEHNNFKEYKAAFEKVYNAMTTKTG
jgi:hypothetical protein